MSRIDVQWVGKSFGPVRALDQISFSIQKNRITGLLGRNGAGKSTLLRIMAGWAFADQGTVAVDGQQVRPGENPNLYLMSELDLYPDGMKPAEAFRLAKRLYAGFDPEYAKMLSEKFQLPLKTNINRLSTGYRSVFKIIMALSVNTPAVLFDEPVLGLDANHRELFYRELLEKYAEHPFTAVVSTHLIDEVAGMMEDVVLLRRGRLLYSGSREELLDQGYTVSGKASLVDQYREGHPWIGEERLGGLKAAYFWGEPAPVEVPEGLELSSLDLQKLFVRLTEEEVEKI